MSNKKPIGKFDKGEIVIYRPKGGDVKFDVRFEKDTIWLDAHQMAQIFDIDRTVVVKHVRNIYQTGELKEKATCAIFAQVASDGRVRKMNLYSLDVIISVFVTHTIVFRFLNCSRENG